MTTVIETPRVLLRELTPDDTDDLYAIFSDPECMRFYPRPFTREETERWIDRNIERYRNEGHGLWAVVWRESGRCIGDCGITIQEIDGEHLPELGYHVAKPYWRRGIAREAARACLEYAFSRFGYEALHAYMTTDNVPSRKVAESVGMRYVKEFEKIVMGQRITEVLYRIPRNEADTLS